LKQKIGEPVKQFSSDAILREALEFILSGDRMAASFLVVRTTKLSLLDSINLLREVEAKLEEVIKRGFETIDSKRKLFGESASPVSDVSKSEP
jgi:hypothetical protein